MGKRTTAAWEREERERTKRARREVFIFLKRYRDWMGRLPANVIVWDQDWDALGNNWRCKLFERKGVRVVRGPARK